MPPSPPGRTRRRKRSPRTRSPDELPRVYPSLMEPMSIDQPSSYPRDVRCAEHPELRDLVQDEGITTCPEAVVVTIPGEPAPFDTWVIFHPVRSRRTSVRASRAIREDIPPRSLSGPIASRVHR